MPDHPGLAGVEEVVLVLRLPEDLLIGAVVAVVVETDLHQVSADLPYSEVREVAGQLIHPHQMEELLSLAAPEGMADSMVMEVMARRPAVAGGLLKLRPEEMAQQESAS